MSRTMPCRSAANRTALVVALLATGSNASAYPCTPPPCEISADMSSCATAAEWIVEGRLIQLPAEEKQVVCDHGQCGSVPKPMPVHLDKVVILKGQVRVSPAGEAALIGASHCFPIVPPDKPFEVGMRYRFYGSSQILGNYATPGFFTVVPAIP